jgi:hypothetical protein
MGQVDRARDVRLNRDVAIKAIPKDHAEGVDPLAGLYREAHALASLNHPNIGGIYVVEQEGASYLVLEFVAGPDLAERLRAGPLPVGGDREDCRPNRRRSAGCPRPWHRPSRSETGHYQSDSCGASNDPGLGDREKRVDSQPSARNRGVAPAFMVSSSAHVDCRHARVYESGAGMRRGCRCQGRSLSSRHLVAPSWLGETPLRKKLKGVLPGAHDRATSIKSSSSSRRPRTISGSRP